MNKETSQETEKRMDKDRRSNQGQMFPSPYPAQATKDHQASKESDAGKEKVTDSLMAIYWG